jgi:hypothetical protein
VARFKTISEIFQRRFMTSDCAARRVLDDNLARSTAMTTIKDRIHKT